MTPRSSGRPMRRLWGPILLVSGLAAMLAVATMLVVRGSPGLPIAVVSLPVMVYAGYQVWKAGHPGMSVWRELGRRARSVAIFSATVLAFLFAQAFPQVVIVIVAVWLVTLVGLFLVLGSMERTKRSDTRCLHHFR